MRARSMLLATALTATLAGCGNAVTTTVDGQVGLAKSDDGTVTALVDTCSIAVTRLDVTAGREGKKPEEENDSLGELRVDQPMQGRLRVPLDAPPSPWRIDRAVRLPEPPDSLIIVTAARPEKNAEVSQVSAKRAQIDALKEGEVLIGSGEVVPEARFHETACRK